MKKIMFNDKYGLTEAVLEGRKTMTRRIVPDGTPLGNWEETEKMSRYKVGEVVAVAQSYHALNKAGFVAPEWCEHTCEDSPGYSNKMFVKADLMLHQIRITSIRVERIQDISGNDCLREGIIDGKVEPKLYGFKNGKHYDTAHTPREAFAILIKKMSGKKAWDDNPWVFVYEFELVK